MLLVIEFATFVLLAGGVSSHEDTCYDKFEYVFKVLERLSDLEKKMELQETKLHQPESNRTLELEEKISSLTRQLQGAAHTAADTYTRWGRKSCPNGTSLVYDGFAAGSMYTSTGAAANYICLTKHPKWNDKSKKDGNNFIYGAEYETGGSVWQKHYQHDVPCAVCRVHRSNVIMVPGRNDCNGYESYRLEYSGYLMSGRQTHAAATEFVCVDDEPEAQTHSSPIDRNGKLFYFVQAKCGSLKCPPYEEGMKITCAVCSLSP